jgi:hypothetical protein
MDFYETKDTRMKTCVRLINNDRKKFPLNCARIESLWTSSPPVVVVLFLLAGDMHKTSPAAGPFFGIRALRVPRPNPSDEAAYSGAHQRYISLRLSLGPWLKTVSWRKKPAF